MIQTILFHDVFLVIRHALDNYKLYALPAAQDLNSNIRLQMDAFSSSIRRQIFWRDRIKVNYGKLHRGIKLPCDELIQDRDPNPDFHQFVQNLLHHVNSSGEEQLNSVSMSDTMLMPFFDSHQVPENTEGFNFVTCHTSDTFWSRYCEDILATIPIGSMGCDWVISSSEHGSPSNNQGVRKSQIFSLENIPAYSVQFD